MKIDESKNEKDENGRFIFKKPEYGYDQYCHLSDEEYNEAIHKAIKNGNKLSESWSKNAV